MILLLFMHLVTPDNTTGRCTCPLSRPALSIIDLVNIIELIAVKQAEIGHLPDINGILVPRAWKSVTTV